MADATPVSPLSAVEIQQIVDQAVAGAAQKIAQQTADQVAQAASQAARQAVDSSITAGSQQIGAEREFEIGKDEAWFANIKRMFDEYQHESLESIRRNRSYVDKTLADAAQFDNQRQVIANQALSNAVETANIVGKNTVVNLDNLQKQHTAHRDLATDRTWNVDEVANLVAKTAVFQDAIAAAVAKATTKA